MLALFSIEISNIYRNQNNYHQKSAEYDFFLPIPLSLFHIYVRNYTRAVLTITQSIFLFTVNALIFVTNKEIVNKIRIILKKYFLLKVFLKNLISNYYPPSFSRASINSPLTKYKYLCSSPSS